MMKGVEMTVSPGFTTNQHDIPIKMCCASCRRRMINNGEGRYCERSGDPVEGCQYCRKWRLPPKLQNAGKGGGRVKSIRYLKFYQERKIKLNNSLKACRIKNDELPSTAEIRREYELEHGSIYLNI